MYKYSDRAILDRNYLKTIPIRNILQLQARKVFPFRRESMEVLKHADLLKVILSVVLNWLKSFLGTKKTNYCVFLSVKSFYKIRSKMSRRKILQSTNKEQATHEYLENSIAIKF